MGIRIIVLILAVAAEELLLCVLIGDIGKVTPVVATELLEVQAADYVPVFILVVGVIYHAVGVLGQSLLADEVRFLNLVALCILIDESKFLKLGVVLELLVVAVAIGIVQGDVVAPVAVRSPGCRENIVVLIEIIRSFLPFVAVSEGIWLDGIIALSIAHQIASQDIEFPQSSLVHILVCADSIIHQCEVGIVVASQHAIPCLSGLLEVADVLIADLEVIS